MRKLPSVFVCIVVIVLATAMLHFDVLFLGEVYSPSGDITYQNYPWRDFYDKELENRRIAMWYPYQACGFPLFAEGQTGMLYPPNIAFHLMFNTWRAIIYGCALSTLIAGLGALFMLLRLGLTKRAALFAAVVCMASGPMIAHLGHFNLVAAASWLPWITHFGLVSLHLGNIGKPAKTNLKSERIFGCFALAFVVALSWLAGHPQMTFISVITFFVIALVILITSGRITKSSLINDVIRFTPPLFGIILGTLAAIPQLWFTWELVRQSNRASFTVADFLSYSFPPNMLATLVHPYAFGAANAWNSPSYHGPDGFVERVAFVGVVPTLLVLFAFAGLVIARACRNNVDMFAGSKSTRTTLLILFTTLFILLLFALGKWGGIYLILNLIPGYGATRIPARFLFPSVLIYGAIAGIMLDYLIALKIRTPRIAFYTYAVVLMLAFVNLRWFHTSFNLTVQEDAAVSTPEVFEEAKKSNIYTRIYHLPPESVEIEDTNQYVYASDIDFFKPCYPSLFGFGSVQWAGELVLKNYKRFMDSIIENREGIAALERRSEAISWLGAHSSGVVEMAQTAKSGLYLCGAMKAFEDDDKLFEYMLSASPLYLDQVALLSGEPEIQPSMRGVAHVTEEDSLPVKQTYSVVASENRIFVRAYAHYNGWRAYLDDEEVKIHRAFGAFQAVEIPAGEHRLVFEFGGRLPYTLKSIQASILIAMVLVGLLFYLHTHKIESKRAKSI